MDVAVARGVQKGTNGAINGAEFIRVGLPIIAGCAHCGATVTAYNAAPGRNGYILCAGTCSEPDYGFPTVEAFEAWAKEDES